MGKQIKTQKTVWASRKKGSNITRLMNDKEAMDWSNKTGQSVFTKMKKWELDQL